MSTEVTFYITIKDANIDTIAHTLRNLGLTVFPSSISDVGEVAFDPNHLTCSAVFVETDGLIGLVLARKESWKKIDGIENIEIIHDKRQKEERPWYDHFMIPLLISTAVYSLGVIDVLLGLVREFELKLDWTTYLIYLFIPAAISFWSGVLYTIRRVYSLSPDFLKGEH